MSTPQEPIEQKVAVMAKSVEDCQRDESACRENNRAEHVIFYNRIGALELEVGKLCVRVGLWAAFGGIIGSALIGIVLKRIGG